MTGYDSFFVMLNSWSTSSAFMLGVAKLFVAKSAFAAFLILSIGLTPQPYPLLPRHLSVAGALTLGIPAFFLALAPSEGEYSSKRFLFDVGRFAVPAGTAAGLGVLASFIFARNVGRLPLIEARTIATTVLVLVGLYLILALEATSRRRATAIGTLVAVMIAVYALVFGDTRHAQLLRADRPRPGRRRHLPRRRRPGDRRPVAHRQPLRPRRRPREHV